MLSTHYIEIRINRLRKSQIISMLNCINKKILLEVLKKNIKNIRKNLRKL